MKDKTLMNDPYKSASEEQKDTPFRSVDDILAYYGNLHGTDYTVSEETSG
ncbi:hypothetical protein [Paenibacillus lemnae]|uniref:Uncharacterized protein n=1 Tax=Paenibacillus lemnae TaxID=1330551 RepID=A0A848M877_PAELE|nr:hypothetical protein [Paenibacillus lemnae]NMO96469.1 hypothetical protein [Paenibacillus lemnae]